jgi:hypothetical protein
MIVDMEKQAIITAVATRTGKTADLLIIHQTRKIVGSAIEEILMKGATRARLGVMETVTAGSRARREPMIAIIIAAWARIIEVTRIMIAGRISTAIQIVTDGIEQGAETLPGLDKTIRSAAQKEIE